MKKVQFQGKTIVITGASKGIGKEIAKILAASGANLCLLARGKPGLDQVVQELSATAKGKIIGVPCDVSDKTAVKEASGKILSEFPVIYGLINNAGTTYPQYFEETPIEEFERVNAVDYLGSVYVTKALIAGIEPGGFISFTSSVVGYMGVFGFSSYAGPKFALFGLAETLAQELASKEISVSLLCPPDTETPGYSEEEKTKPFETQELSKSAKLMTASAVAKSFVSGIKKRKFIITNNFESALFYRLTRLTPGLVRFVMKVMVRGIQKKMK